MIKKTLECRKVELFVDIHGHSRSKNLFIYGCSKQQNGPHMQVIPQHSFSTADRKMGKNGVVLTQTGVIGNGITTLSLQSLTTKEKVFPWLLNKNCEDFSYHCCGFGVNKSKESTGRVVVWREFSIQNSYTLEVSFCGPTGGSKNGFHFKMQDLINMGKSFAKTILEYGSVKNQKNAQAQIETFYKQGAVNFPVFS